MSDALFPWGTRAGWRKSSANPVLRHEDYGTCFDPGVIVDEAPARRYRMYLSWRPQNVERNR
jgi:hypothetical protein